jgi:hypothetical protein
MASASKSLPQAAGNTGPASTTSSNTEFLAAVRNLVNTYQESLQRAQFSANSRQLQATLTCSQAVQEAGKRAAGLTAEPAHGLRSSLEQQSATGYSDAYHKYWAAVLEAQTFSQKEYERVTGEYYGGIRDIWGELKGGVDDANKALAHGLKDALVKVDISAADLPALLAICNAVSLLSGT